MPTKECSFAKSDMTPCVRKDGDLAFTMDSSEQPICVGCERTPTELGVDRPANWDTVVAKYKQVNP